MDDYRRLGALIYEAACADMLKLIDRPRHRTVTAGYTDWMIQMLRRQHKTAQVRIIEMVVSHLEAYRTPEALWWNMRLRWYYMLPGETSPRQIELAIANGQAIAVATDFALLADILEEGVIDGSLLDRQVYAPEQETWPPYQISTEEVFTVFTKARQSVTGHAQDQVTA